MRIRRLRLSNFRNYNELDFSPSPALNLLVGSNAQGKTNILEAISLLATTRSLRASRESELVLRGKEISVVSADVDREREGEVELQLAVLQSDKKTVHVNGMRRSRVVDLLGELNVVTFSAGDVSIVCGEPSVRRHYLNVEISQISPGYVYSLGRYKRVLEQRNRLLKDLRERPRSGVEAGLEAWNMQLAQHGAPLIEKRRFFLERLAPLADTIHRELTEGREGLQIAYVPSIPLPGAAESMTEAAIQTLFAKQIAGAAEDELRRGLTLLGPQRDDIAFSIDGMDARIFGSQGQQRTVTLAVKLAEYQLFQDYVGEAPVLLLDDVMSDLDDSRRGRLLHWIRNRGQTFLTCTSVRSFPDAILEKAVTFRVAGGTVVRDSGS